MAKKTINLVVFPPIRSVDCRRPLPFKVSFTDKPMQTTYSDDEVDVTKCIIMGLVGLCSNVICGSGPQMDDASAEILTWANRVVRDGVKEGGITICLTDKEDGSFVVPDVGIIDGFEGIVTVIFTTDDGSGEKENSVLDKHLSSLRSRRGDSNSSSHHIHNNGNGDNKSFRSALLKFERINAHLANERTWLAWIRTAVSILGCAFTFLGLAENSDSGYNWASITLGVGFVACVLLTFFTGWFRYKQVKNLLTRQTQDIHDNFERLGVGWQSHMLGLLLVSTAILYAYGGPKQKLYT